MEASHLITEIKGVGVKTTALFSKLHIETIKDLISYFPRGYDHYEEALPVGELCTGKVQSVRACIVRRRWCGQKEWSSPMRRQEMPPGE